MNSKELAYTFDHTQLKPYAIETDFIKLCTEAEKLGCHMVAVNSYPVKLCKKLLKESAVHVGAAISFPLGQATIRTKLFETEESICNGADEIDYVINIQEAKMHNWSYIEYEMNEITSKCKDHNVIVKAIFENCYLDKDEISGLALIAKRVRPDFIKTSTGFGTYGARVEDIKLMKGIVGNDVEVKAAGGIRDLNTCMSMLAAGATRIGTSSSVSIINEFLQKYEDKA